MSRDSDDAALIRNAMGFNAKANARSRKAAKSACEALIVAWGAEQGGGEFSAYYEARFVSLSPRQLSRVVARAALDPGWAKALEVRLNTIVSHSQDTRAAPWEA